MKKAPSIYMAFLVIFVAGWLMGNVTAFPISPSTSVATNSLGVTVGANTQTSESLSFWGRLTHSFLDLWFSIPDAIRLRRPTYKYSSDFPPGLAQKLQEMCQQAKQSLTASIERQIAGGELSRQQTKALWQKMMADQVKAMENSIQQYITAQKETGKYVNEASFQRAITEFQRINAEIDADGDAKWQSTNEFMRSLPDRLPC